MDLQGFQHVSVSNAMVPGSLQAAFAVHLKNLSQQRRRGRFFSIEMKNGRMGKNGLNVPKADSPKFLDLISIKSFWIYKSSGSFWI